MHGEYALGGDGISTVFCVIDRFLNLPFEGSSRVFFGFHVVLIEVFFHELVRKMEIFHVHFYGQFTRRNEYEGCLFFCWKPEYFQGKFRKKTAPPNSEQQTGLGSGQEA